MNFDVLDNKTVKATLVLSAHNKSIPILQVKQQVVCTLAETEANIKYENRKSHLMVKNDTKEILWSILGHSKNWHKSQSILMLS